MAQQRRNHVLHENIVRKLKQLRKEKGLTLETVTFDTDIHVSRIEMGRHSTTLTTLSDLCDYYGVTLEEFFRGVSSK